MPVLSEQPQSDFSVVKNVATLIEQLRSLASADRATFFHDVELEQVTVKSFLYKRTKNFTFWRRPAALGMDHRGRVWPPEPLS